MSEGVEVKDGYVIIDKRGGKNADPKPPCRVCGSPVEHSKNYNKPTMECIFYLRKQIQDLQEAANKYE